MKKRIIAGGLLAIGLIGGGVLWGVQTDNIQAAVPGTKANLTMEEAEAIAEKETKAVVESIELEREWSGPVYEVDTSSIDLDIDGNTGEILKEDHDDDGVDDHNEAVNITVTQEEAIEAAKKKVKGNVTEVELDDGHYEIEVRDGKTETDVYVHGVTGDVTVGETETDD